jgi:hypothetical protein
VTHTRDPLPDDLRERAGIASALSTNGYRKPASPSPSLYKGSGRRDVGPELVRLSDVKPPGPRRYLLRDLVLASYITLLYGTVGWRRASWSLPWP